MKTVYLISIIVLWILIAIQIVQLVRSGRLLKRQMKELEELDDIHQKCNQLYDEMNEEKQKYQEAKERLLATLVPDLEETTDDDTPLRKVRVLNSCTATKTMRLPSRRPDVTWNGWQPKLDILLTACTAACIKKTLHLQQFSGIS